MILGVTASSIYKGSVSSFDPSYQAILDYATTQGYTLPSVGVQAVQNQLVLDLKSNGIWDEEEVFYMFAGDGDINFACIDWKNTSRSASPGAITSFISNEGIRSLGGINAYIDLGFKSNGLTRPYTDSGFSFAIKNSDTLTAANDYYLMGESVSNPWLGDSGKNLMTLHSTSGLYYASQGNSWSTTSGTDPYNIDGYYHIYNNSTNQFFRGQGVESNQARTIGLAVDPTHNFRLNAIKQDNSTLARTWQYFSMGTAQEDKTYIKETLITNYLTTLNTI